LNYERRETNDEWEVQISQVASQKKGLSDCPTVQLTRHNSHSDSDSDPKNRNAFKRNFWSKVRLTEGQQLNAGVRPRLTDELWDVLKA